MNECDCGNSQVCMVQSSPTIYACINCGEIAPELVNPCAEIEYPYIPKPKPYALQPIFVSPQTYKQLTSLYGDKLSRLIQEDKNEKDII